MLRELGCQPQQQQLLGQQAATALLCQHARDCAEAPLSLIGTDALRFALNIAGGLPLAIKVLGGMLRDVQPTHEAWQVWPSCARL